MLFHLGRYLFGQQPIEKVGIGDLLRTGLLQEGFMALVDLEEL
jgi:hypothetical protein